jgi:transcriptional regulator with XRE-family HTH domain
VHEQPDPVLAAVLKRLREDRDVTQEELAFGAGITVSSLSRIERGLTSPGWITVGKIVHALGISMAELVQELERASEEVSGSPARIRLRGTPDAPPLPSAARPCSR